MTSKVTTAKQKVKGKYPDAYAFKWADGWVIYSRVVNPLALISGRARSAMQAWYYAAEGLKAVDGPAPDGVS